MKLASVEKVLEICPALNSDNLELARILGWQVVIKKGEFKAGDFVVYIPIDSILPEQPAFEFLRERKFRIKTVKLRGNLSQGICFPLSILPAGQGPVPAGTEISEGLDVTELIGVRHYEKPVPVCLAGEVKGQFPDYCSKTDETMLQSCPGVLEEFQGLEVYITVKVDGTSATYAHYNGGIDVCSRNLSLKESEENIYWMMEKQYHIIEKLKDAGNFAIQGEICGNGIQKNRLGLAGHKLLVFDVYDIEKRRHLNYADLKNFCDERNLEMVPLLEITGFNFTLEDLLEKARGTYAGTYNRREGIVIRPTTGRYSRLLYSRLSVKVINNDYLLKDED